MIKLIIAKYQWSDQKDLQKAYERGRSDQSEEDAHAIMDWLVETGQLKSWIAPEIEIVEEEKEDEED